MRHHNLQVTGSINVNNIGVVTKSDLATYTGSAEVKLSSLETYTGSTNTRLNSIETISASNISRIGSLESFSSSIYTTNTFTSSTLARLNSLETTSASVNTTNTTQNSRLDALEIKTGSLATTGSNVFVGTQVITGSLYVTTDLVVQGSSSIQNITGSSVNIGTNKVILNTANPAVRYAGISVIDSGSTGLTGSILWDSTNNNWLYQNPSGSSYTSAKFIAGPQSSALGSEPGLVTNYIQKAIGDDHISSSAIYDDGSVVAIKNTTHITGSLNVGATSYPSINLYTTSGTNFALTNRYTDNRLSIDKIGTGELVNILGSGAVGIGITNPSYKLDVVGDIHLSSELYLDNGYYLRFKRNSGGTSIQTLGIPSGTDDVRLLTSGDFNLVNGSLTNLMTVKNGGNVGISSGSPVRKLDIVATSEQLRLAYDTSGTVYSDFRNDSAGGLLVNTSGGYIIHYIGGNLIMRMNATNGQVGIGTNPSEKLDVNGNIRSTGTSTILRLENTGGTAQSWWVGQDIAGTYDGRFYIYNMTSSTHALTINKSNRIGIGIGTSDAYSPLTLKGSNISWGETMTIYPSTSGYITLAFRLEGTDTTTGTWAFGKQSTQESGGTQYLQIAKNGLSGGALHRADAAQIWDPANGNAYFGFKVGIGTTTANGNLQFSNSVNTRKIVLYQGGNNDYEFYGFGVESAKLIYSTYTTGDDHVFVAGTSGTARNELMRIKGNGQILRPSQPAFLAYCSSAGFSVTGGSWYNISNAITTEAYDVGSNYSTSTAGRFVAPVAGKYLFYAGGWAQINSSGDRYAWCAVVNGGGYTFIGGGNYCSVDSPLSNYSIVYDLAAGDYVELYAFSAVSGTWGPGTHRVYWGGYLL